MAGIVVTPICLVPGTRQNIESNLQRSKMLAGMIEHDARPLAECCRELRACKAWETYFDDEPRTWERMCREFIGYEAEFIAEIEAGVSVLESRGRVGPISSKEACDAAAMARDENFKPLLDGPGPATKEEKAIAYNVRNSDYGNEASYLVRRMKRDAPDIAAALGRGEYKSARSAAIAAGIVKVPTRLQVAQKAFNKLTACERRKFFEWLKESD